MNCVSLNRLGKICKRKIFCRKWTKTLFSFNYWQQVNNPKNLYCIKCSLKFNEKYAFELHLSLKHGQKIQVKTKPESYTDHVESEKSYNFETGNSKNEAKTRFNSQSESNSNAMKSYECIVCSNCFSNKVLLRRHISSVHEKKKPLECKICDTSFSQKPRLNKHVL